MPIGSNDSITFNLDSITDNQILVYDAATGSFKNETAAVSANASVTGLGRNVGTFGVGIYKQNDSQYLEFYKLQAGSNATIALNNNVITIDAVVGTGTTSLGSANANTIVVADTNGNVLNGSDSLTFDGTTFSFIGSGNNVTVANGLVTSNNLVTTNLTFGGMVMPTADGTAGQVLQTDGSNALSWVNRTDITGKTDRTDFNAHVATAVVTTANTAPALNNLYSLGNNDNKYAQVFSTYFRGTADLAVNSQNLNSIPAANYRLVADSFTKAEVNALIANVDTANTSGLISNVRVSDGTTSFVEESGNVTIEGTAGQISVGADTSNKKVVLSLDTDVVTKTFRQINANGTNIVADTATDTVELIAGSGITITGDATAETITFTSTGGGGGGGNSNVSLTDFSVTTATANGNGSLAYNNAGVFTFTPANIQATTQSLSWNAGTSELSISSGNTVDLSVLAAQDLTISGNVISLTGQSGNVDLTSTLAGVAGNYGDSNVATYLTTNNYATETYVNTANTNMQTYVNTANTNVVAYVDNQVTLLKGGANVNLDSLAEVANALNNSNTQLSTVAFTGNHSDIQSRPTISLSGSDLTYDGTTLDLSGLGATGPQGPQGNAGADGKTISSASVSGAGAMTLTMNDSSTINVTGNVQGAEGAQGTAGVGITSVSLVGGANLVLNYSNSSTQDVGNIKGPQGATGATGSQGAGLNDVSVSTASASGSGSLAYNSGSGVFTFTPPDLSSFITSDSDAQDLTISGNVISLTGQSGNVDLTSALGGVAGNYGDANVDAHLNQTGPTSGHVLSWNGSDYAWVAQSGGGSGDITSVVAGTGLSGGATSGDATVNLADTAVTAGTYGSATKSAQFTVDAQGRITSAANVNISGGGGGGSSSYEYFKLYYTSAGAIDTTQGTGGVSDKSTNIGNVTINNAASNSCEVIVDFGGNYNFPPLAITAYGYSQSTSEYLIKGQSASVNNTTLKLDGSGSPHGTLGSSNITLSLTRSETGSSSGFGQTTHAWIYFSMGS